MTISRKEQIDILRKMTDEQIDYSDAPPLSHSELQEMSLFIPPEKRTVTIRLDADVLGWLKERQPRGYQTLINALLRDYMRKKQQSASVAKSTKMG